jgi:hypothetical protein
MPKLKAFLLFIQNNKSISSIEAVQLTSTSTQWGQEKLTTVKALRKKQNSMKFLSDKQNSNVSVSKTNTGG